MQVTAGELSSGTHSSLLQLTMVQSKSQTKRVWTSGRLAVDELMTWSIGSLLEAKEHSQLAGNTYRKNASNVRGMILSQVFLSCNFATINSTPSTQPKH
jgi:hypothetical protein